MKLITETIENVQFITEEEGNKQNHYIQGIFLQSDLKNRNGRIYPKHIMEKEVNRFIKEKIDMKRAYGELGHPEGPTINLDRVSHMIVSLKEDGKNYIGKAKILDTPMGRIAKNLLDEGASLGVSSRGLGSLKMVENGMNEVQDDFFLATPADIVADPSAPDAFVQGIMENREWMVVDGVWTYRNVEESRRAIQKASQRNLEEAKLEVFEKFLRSISRL
jgi:hypothetical protein